MKPIARGKNIFFREIGVDDAAFVLKLRNDPLKGQYISSTTNDIKIQREYIAKYLAKDTDYYFIICDKTAKPIGTVRIYDIHGDDFCWGSWILTDDAHPNAAIESALLVYDYAFFSLQFKLSHFDVRKANTKVINFHKRFGAETVDEDELNIYFRYTLELYLQAREKYKRYLPKGH